MRFIKRLFFLVLLVILAFFIYRLISPKAAKNLLIDVKTFSNDKIGTKFSLTGKDISITSTTLSITGDIVTSGLFDDDVDTGFWDDDTLSVSSGSSTTSSDVSSGNSLPTSTTTTIPTTTTTTTPSTSTTTKPTTPTTTTSSQKGLSSQDMRDLKQLMQNFSQ